MPRFLFPSGSWRGTELIVEDGMLRHQGSGVFELMPLGHLGSVRVVFQRDTAQLGWGIALAVVALLIFITTGALESWTGSWAREVGSQAGSDGGQGFGSVLLASLRGLEKATGWLPYVATAIGLIGVITLLLGVRGHTTLTLTISGLEREFQVNGHNTQMIDFAEALGGHLASAAP